MAKTLSRFYIIKKDLGKTTASLYYRIQDLSRGIDQVFSTSVKVNVAEWQKAISSKEEWVRFHAHNIKLFETLTQLENAFKAETEKPTFDREAVKSAILSIVDPKKADILRKKKEVEEAQKRAEVEAMKEKERLKIEALKRFEAKAKKEREKIWFFLENFCADIVSGKRLNGNDRYSPNTCKVWNSFKKIYDKFDIKHQYRWDDINRELISKFLASMAEQKYMVTAINKYLVCFRALVGYAYADGIHNNDRALKLFSKKKIEEKDKAVEIYLSEEELQALYEMDITGLKGQVRDVFLVGCYTCQRVSDYTNISESCFIKTAKGTPVIRLIQKKTHNEVKIPIMNPNLRAICEKYEYNIPCISDVIINRYIKKILQELSETVPSLGKKVATKLTMKQKGLIQKGKLDVECDPEGNAILPRYNCVTTHTARRIGITNMYLSNKYTILQMMHVSGHKTQKTFMDYIKLSSDEIADEIDAIANAKSDVF